MARQIVFVCVALFALQATHALPDLKSIVQTEWEKLRSQVQDGISRVEDTVDSLNTKLETDVQTEFAKVKSSVEGFAQKVIDKIDGIKNKAVAEGKAVADCIVAAPGEVEDVAAQVIQGAISCLTNPINEGHEIISSLISLAEQANQTFYNANAALAVCDATSGALESSLCKINAIGGAAVQVTSITSQISADVTKGTSLISNLPNTFSTCEVTVWTNAPVQAASVITEVKQCLKDAVAA